MGVTIPCTLLSLRTRPGVAIQSLHFCVIARKVSQRTDEAIQSGSLCGMPRQCGECRMVPLDCRVAALLAMTGRSGEQRIVNPSVNLLPLAGDTYRPDTRFKSVRHKGDGHLAVAGVRPCRVVLIGAGVVGTTTAPTTRVADGRFIVAHCSS
jgi:hypothetical protein